MKTEFEYKGEFMFWILLFSNEIQAKKCGFKHAKKVTMLEPEPLSEISGGEILNEFAAL